MLGKKSSPSVFSPNSRDGVTSKEQIIVATETGFFDAMLTFGWLAERQVSVLYDGAVRVIGVNDAFRYWLRDNGLAPILDEIYDDGISVKEFLERVLQDEHSAVGSIVAGNLIWITQEVEKLRSEHVTLDRSEYELLFDTPIEQYTVQRTLRFVDKKNVSPHPDVLAGVRVVAPAAIRLRSSSERDRVDLVSVCQVLKEGDGWRVARYQGLLQQAWLRVKSTIRAGTKEGTVALMGRNMSHNIGSHALFYMEMDESEPTKKTFYRYLRGRMELLAGFATSMPLSSVPDRLSSVVENFTKNTELLERIAKSERITTVAITFDGNSDPDVAFPGGILSAQALYAILENNIRDSAKHGRTVNSEQSGLELRISAQEAEKEFAEEFIKVVVSDNRKNYDTAEKSINKSLADLRIVDEVGSLKAGDWGIKERFICAALLRGSRLEDIDIQLQKGRGQEIKYSLGDYAPEGEPRILDITSVDGNLAWVFYLLKPKDILLIGDFEFAERHSLEEKFKDRINVFDFKWLQKNIALPSKVRHRFVVVYVTSEKDLTDLEALNDKLPYRVIVCLPEGLKLDASSNFAPITRADLDLHNLSLGRLYQLWVNWLVELKHPSVEPESRLMRVLNWMRLTRNSHTPEIAFRDDGLKVLRLEESTGMFRWEMLELKDYDSDRPVLLFDRHGSCKYEAPGEEGSKSKAMWTESCQHMHRSIMHYETYEGEDALSRFAKVATHQIDPNAHLDPPTLGFSFLEAGLTKILIVDERLDPTSNEEWYHPESRFWRCSYKELFRWKGIDIRGGEFASDKIPPRKELINWVRKCDYDFLVLHKGIVDKLIKRVEGDKDESPQKLMAELFATLQEHVRHIIIHSGRMSASELPSGVKFMSLSNVDTWIKNNSPKMQIVEDLCLLRRP
jgi:hypothetical protein